MLVYQRVYSGIMMHYVVTKEISNSAYFMAEISKSRQIQLGIIAAAGGSQRSTSRFLGDSVLHRWLMDCFLGAGK
jgi:hypothetical protein